ncbi:MAG: Lrp/AsnC family transcriptional regulator [Pseudomonadota bacterium]
MDAIDRTLIRTLKDQGRASIQDLAARAGLSASPCARRVRALEEAGVIEGYSATVNEAKLGYAITVFVSVRLRHQVDDALMTFERAISACPEVVDCWLMTGNQDYLLRVVIEDLASFEQFLTARLTKIDSVASIESSIPLRRVKAARFRVP